MKITERHNTTMIQGEVETVNMTLTAKGIIAATKMFRDQIYTHKAWAVVREIICNAIDEHKKHGISRPIQITLPTANDLHFRVRDFAHGLDKDMVFSVFFQYFASTKDQDNDAIGGFGIGAKSPLAYSDVFYVDSFHGGHKTSYVSTVDGEASQAHKMALQNSSETGIEVSIPVESGDIRKFRELIQYFVNNAKFDNFTFVGGEIKKQEIAWTVDNKFGRVGSIPQLFRSGSNIYAQVGDVLYPIDSTPEIRNPFYQVAVLELENGSVDINPSRERLELSKRNIFLINKALADLCTEATAEYTASMTAATTAREKFKVQSVSGMFRSTPANVLQVMPEKLNVSKSGHSTVTWDKTQVLRGDEKTSFYRWGGTEFFEPSFVGRNNSTSYSILLTGDSPVRIYDIVAYAEKHGIPAPVVCVKSSKAPKDWVVDSDLWIYDETKIDKAEVKAVRARYATPKAGGVKRAVVKLADDTVLGYKSRTRSHYNQITPNNMSAGVAAGVKYILCDFDGQSYVEHELANQLKMNVCFVYCYISNIANWKADKLPTGADFMPLDKFIPILKKEAQKQLTANVIPTPKNGLNLEHGGTFGGSKYKIDNDIIRLINKLKLAFPDLKAAKSNPLWDKAQKVWDNLKPEEKEMALIYEDHRWGFRNYPLLQEQAEKIWGRVFP
jgi:hypothetical protein